MQRNRLKPLAYLALSALLLTGCSKLTPQQDTKQEEELRQETKTYTVKENPSYFAPANPTKYIAATYDALSASLSQNEADQAKAAATYFLADFFTLSNKEEEGDVGGMDMIPSASADAFREYAKYYYYHVLPVIRSKQGPGALPEVTNVELTSQKQEEVTYMDQTYPGYSWTVALTYADSPDSSEFKTSAKCTIIRMDDVHYVDQADVTGAREAGEPASVWRVVAVTDQ